jgi:hypothetical protein
MMQALILNLGVGVDSLREYIRDSVLLVCAKSQQFPSHLSEPDAEHPPGPL